MAVHSFQQIQFIPASLEQVWDFFSNPANLQAITPPQWKFRIVSPPYDGEIYPGQVIEYKVSPLSGLRLYWMTEITQVMPLKFFVDDQRRGPYSLWHHQHHFRELEGGTEMKDIFHYAIPFWILGDLINHLFVKKKLKVLFEYRRMRIEEIFGKGQGE